MNLIQLAPKGIFVFVGDTHGDFDASKYIINKYSKPNHKIVFLGDYVDRGDQSKENVDFLLAEKKKHPKKIYLLQGNHERYVDYDFDPAHFWWRLDGLEREKYGNIFEKLPLALSVGNILAVHASLPNIEKLEDINKIEDLSEKWHSLVWEDLADDSYDYHGTRLCLNEIGFNKIMKSIGKSLLIRSHNWKAPESMFDGRCLTLFTSQYYSDEVPRQIAIADFTKNPNIKSVDDLVIEEI